MTNSIQHLIFDCDGVLVDSEILATRITLQKLSDYGYESDEMAFSSQYSGYLTEEILQMLNQSHGLKFKEGFADELFNEMEKAFNTVLKPVSGIPELIKSWTLPKNVVTNGHSQHVKRALYLTELGDYFRPEIFSIERVTNGKPAPDIYLLALEELGLKGDEVLVIEDSVAGVTAAKAAGTWVIGFTGASHLQPGQGDKLIEAGADFIATCTPELDKLFKELIG